MLEDGTEPTSKLRRALSVDATGEEALAKGLAVNVVALTAEWSEVADKRGGAVNREVVHGVRFAIGESGGDSVSLRFFLGV